MRNLLEIFHPFLNISIIKYIFLHEINLYLSLSVFLTSTYTKQKTAYSFFNTNVMKLYLQLIFDNRFKLRFHPFHLNILLLLQVTLNHLSFEI